MCSGKAYVGGEGVMAFMVALARWSEVFDSGPERNKVDTKRSIGAFNKNPSTTRMVPHVSHCKVKDVDNR